MTGYEDITRKIGDPWVATLNRTQDAVTAAAKGVRTRMDAPQIPIPEPLSKLGEVLADRLPHPSNIVRANLKLTERVLVAQRDLTLRFLDAFEDRAAYPVAKRAPAKKAPARKPAATK